MTATTEGAGDLGELEPDDPVDVDWFKRKGVLVLLKTGKGGHAAGVAIQSKARAAAAAAAAAAVPGATHYYYYYWRSKALDSEQLTAPLASSWVSESADPTAPRVRWERFTQDQQGCFVPGRALQLESRATASSARLARVAAEIESSVRSLLESDEDFRSAGVVEWHTTVERRSNGARHDIATARLHMTFKTTGGELETRSVNHHRFDDDPYCVLPRPPLGFRPDDVFSLLHTLGTTQEGAKAVLEFDPALPVQLTALLEERAQSPLLGTAMADQTVLGEFAATALGARFVTQYPAISSWFHTVGKSARYLLPGGVVLCERFSQPRAFGGMSNAVQDAGEGAFPRRPDTVVPAEPGVAAVSSSASSLLAASNAPWVGGFISGESASLAGDAASSGASGAGPGEGAGGGGGGARPALWLAPALATEMGPSQCFPGPDGTSSLYICFKHRLWDEGAFAWVSQEQWLRLSRAVRGACGSSAGEPLEAALAQAMVDNQAVRSGNTALAVHATSLSSSAGIRAYGLHGLPAGHDKFTTAFASMGLTAPLPSRVLAQAAVPSSSSSSTAAALSASSSAAAASPWSSSTAASAADAATSTGAPARAAASPNPDCLEVRDDEEEGRADTAAPTAAASSSSGAPRFANTTASLSPFSDVYLTGDELRTAAAAGGLLAHPAAACLSALLIVLNTAAKRRLLEAGAPLARQAVVTAYAREMGLPPPTLLTDDSSLEMLVYLPQVDALLPILAGGVNHRQGAPRPVEQAIQDRLDRNATRHSGGQSSSGSSGDDDGGLEGVAVAELFASYRAGERLFSIGFKAARKAPPEVRLAQAAANNRALGLPQLRVAVDRVFYSDAAVAASLSGWAQVGCVDRSCIPRRCFGGAPVTARARGPAEERGPERLVGNVGAGRRWQRRRGRWAHEQARAAREVGMQTRFAASRSPSCGFTVGGRLAIVFTVAFFGGQNTHCVPN